MSVNIQFIMIKSIKSIFKRSTFELCKELYELLQMEGLGVEVKFHTFLIFLITHIKICFIFYTMKEGNRQIQKVFLLFLKNSSLGQWTTLIPKMLCLQKSGSTLRIFSNFSTMKGVKRYLKIILMVFLKKFFQLKWCMVITLDLI